MKTFFPYFQTHHQTVHLQKKTLGKNVFADYEPPDDFGSDFQSAFFDREF